MIGVTGNAIVNEECMEGCENLIHFGNDSSGVDVMSRDAAWLMISLFPRLLMDA